MKAKKTYWKNRVGQIVERRFPNEIVSQMLIGGTEDPYYIQNTLIPAQEETVRVEALIEKEIRIQKKMREMAEKELEKDGE